MVGAPQQVADLKAANEDFDKTYSSRTVERYARINSVTEISSAHTGMEAAYADVADILNAIYIQSLVLTPDEEALAEVMAIANEINALITQFALILARRDVGKSMTSGTPDPDKPENPENPKDPETPDPGEEGNGTPEDIDAKKIKRPKYSAFF